MNGLPVEFLEILELGGRFVTVRCFFPAIDNYIPTSIPYLMGSGSSTFFFP
jgi:hypothetical protein